MPTIPKHEQKIVEKVEKYRQEMTRRAYRYLGMAMDGAKIDDEGPIPEAWKDRPDWQMRERLARDGRKSRRNAPMYLELAQKLVEQDQKAKAAHGTAIQLNIGAINLVKAPSYDEVLVDAPPVAAGQIIDVVPDNVVTLPKKEETP